MIEKKIEQFYRDNKLNLTIIKKVVGLQLTTFFAKIDCYDFKTINKIIKLQDALCLFLQTDNINIKQDNSSGCIIFEIPLKDRKILSFDELQENYVKDNRGLYVNIGKDTKNDICTLDLCKTPHLLVGGTTGSGKSVFINSILTSLLYNYSPSELELVLIDIKQVEFSMYKKIPHLLCDTITNLQDTKIILNECIEDINRRYEKLKLTKYRTIQEYNNRNEEKMKYRLIVIDELAELFMLENKSKLRADIEGYDRIETQLCRIAQIGRACGVHLILATQRPSTDVITGLLKSNIPSRVALSVSSAVDSRVILDSIGAERLTGKGDMLLKLVGNNNYTRLQSAFISDKEQIEYINTIKDLYSGYKNDISYKLEEKKQSLEQTTINKEQIEDTLCNYIRDFIEHNSQYTYDFIKKIIYNYNNRDSFIQNMYEKGTEKEYAKNIYLRTANKIFADYDKVYKPRQKQQTQRQTIVIQRPRKVTRRKVKRKRYTGIGIAYCLGCGLYGFMKGITK